MLTHVSGSAAAGEWKAVLCLKDGGRGRFPRYCLLINFFKLKAHFDQFLSHLHHIKLFILGLLNQTIPKMRLNVFMSHQQRLDFLVLPVCDTLYNSKEPKAGKVALNTMYSLLKCRLGLI